MTYEEEKALKKLNDIIPHLYRFDYVDVKMHLGKFLPRLPISCIKQERTYRFHEGPWARDPSILVRCRPNSSKVKYHENKLPFTKVSQISHVPYTDKNAIQEIGFGRANLRFEPRFYCSNMVHTACIEVLTNGFSRDPDNQKFVTAGYWRIVEKLNLAEIPFSKKYLNLASPIEPDSYSKMLVYREEWFHNLLSNQNSFLNSPDFTAEAISFFSDQFSKVEIDHHSDYYLSNLLST